ncbi:MAG: M20/M25/M40 family metallo-hydrolase [Candidatus Brockarchaeota archaeon]|nr:M20/M25/M40 family metallo-hydrolase [Candidatus Brockarchaeota archaeon]
MAGISTDGITKALKALCEGVGPRFTGTEGEAKAEELIESEFKRAGAAASRHEFGIWIWDCREASLRILKPERAEVECMPVSYTGSTGGAVRGEAVFIETASPFEVAKREVKGKVGVMAGSVGGSHSPEEGSDKLRRLVSSGLKGLVMVEDRVPTSWPRAEGIPPYWFKHGTMPMVSVSFQDGLKLRREGVEVEMLVDSATKDTRSCNIIGEIKGSKDEGDVIVVSAHHDTVPGSVGACDNASGVAILLELAKRFAERRPAKTIRFISFGGEEQLSVGATSYYSKNRLKGENLVLCVNIDGVGAGIGTNEVSVIGGTELRDYVKFDLMESGYSAEVDQEVSPFSDHYPASMQGVPSVWFRGRRPNFFYHSKFDDLEHVFVEDIAETAGAIAHLISSVDSAKIVPFSREIPAEQQGKIERYKRELYGLV